MLDRLDHGFELQRRFTADASHELRTPLAMLVSRAGLALERPRTIPEYQGVLQAIRDDGLHMGRIVNDLLILASADAGGALEVTELLDAGDLVRSVVDAMSPLAEDGGVHLEARACAPLALVGDQTRLTQLLINLVENSLSHTPAEGKVVVSAARDGETFVIQVADTGTGIAPEHLPHVFERFFRGDRDRPRGRAGAGLGLSLCKSIARAHGGDISLQSDYGKGTLATVRLPRASSDVARRPNYDGERTVAVVAD
jgi:signal transduction histidine kinase